MASMATEVVWCGVIAYHYDTVLYIGMIVATYAHALKTI